jgi:hypothetical protein
MPEPTWLETANVVVNTITAIGALITAYATWRALHHTRKRDAEGAPTLADPIFIYNTSDDSPVEMPLALDDAFKPTWRIASVIVWSLARPFVTAEYDAIPDEWGSHRKQPKSWARRMVFDPPRQGATLLIRKEAPRRFRLRCKLVLRADPRITTWRTLSVRMPDLARHAGDF